MTKPVVIVFKCEAAVVSVGGQAWPVHGLAGRGSVRPTSKFVIGFPPLGYPRLADTPLYKPAKEQKGPETFLFSKATEKRQKKLVIGLPWLFLTR